MAKRGISIAIRAGLFGAIALAAAFAKADANRVLRMSAESLESSYAATCGADQKDRLCLLSASSLNLGDANHVLIFRGENQKFSKPFSSSITRAETLPTALCARGVCSSAELMQNLSNLIGQLISDVSRKYPGYYGGYLFENGQWDTSSQPEETLFDDRKSASVTEVLASAHFRGVQMALEAMTPGRKISLDPFVSLTPSPAIAMKFAHSYDQHGRIWILSLPRESVSKLSRGDCRNSNFLKNAVQRPGVYDFSACVRSAVYGNEKEIDALMTVPPEWIAGYIDGL